MAVRGVLLLRIGHERAAGMAAECVTAHLPALLSLQAAVSLAAQPLCSVLLLSLLSRTQACPGNTYAQ